MDSAGFVPLVFSPLKYTNSKNQDRNEERKSDPRALVFLF